MQEVGASVLKTLIYGDIFNYPISKDELWKFLIGKKLGRDSFEDFLKSSPERIGFSDGFYYLSGRENNIKIRIKRKKESQRKILIAKKISKQLSVIPTIKFVGISGALSLENSERDDDIDLFVIVSKGSLWLTRLVMIIVLLFIGRYRRRNQREVSDKICLNMIIDESAMPFPKKRQDLYTAHEIAQLMPVFERDGIYRKFKIANRWVGKYLPNFVNRIKNHESRIKSKKRNLLFIFEHIAKIVQLWLIKKHITTETVKDNFLAFHPYDYKNKVLSEYKNRLKKYEI
jgi:hypothetical protein